MRVGAGGMRANRVGVRDAKEEEEEEARDDHRVGDPRTIMKSFRHLETTSGTTTPGGW